MTLDPYSSHMEFLLKHCHQAENILELGCGKYSTPLFLNKTLFPHMKQLVSIEPDQEWAERIQRDFPDPRMLLWIPDDPISVYLDMIDISKYDLIFVDNAPLEERVNAIACLARNVSTQKVVIHDFEVEDYRKAAQPFTHTLIDGFRTPHTAMVWK